MNLWPSNSPDLNPVDYYPRSSLHVYSAVCYGDVAGWLAGWLSVTAGIVSKQLNLS